MVALIGVISSAGRGVSYYERDGYYAQADPAHKEASAWIGKGAQALDLSGPVDPRSFQKILEGYVPDGGGKRLGKRGSDGPIQHRPGRDVTFSAPKSVSLAALVGGDRRIVAAHDKAVNRTLAWVEKHAVKTRVMDAEPSPRKPGTWLGVNGAGDSRTARGGNGGEILRTPDASSGGAGSAPCSLFAGVAELGRLGPTAAEVLFMASSSGRNSSLCRSRCESIVVGVT